MKKYTLLFAAILFALIIVNSCTKTTEEIEDINIELVSRSDCKNDLKGGEITDSMSCIKYSFSGEELIINHINAGFNCCPGEITCTSQIKNDTIVIEESEEAPLCNCNCLFDLKIKVNGLLHKQYFIKVKEPYVQDQKELFFAVDLNKSPVEGSHCVVRVKYPWGMK